MISTDPEIRAAVINGEQKFQVIGCSGCHIPTLPLDHEGWIYTEPNLYNPRGNLRVGEAPQLAVDLSSDNLPPPRLSPVAGIVNVPVYTDLKLHDITSGPGDPNREPLDMNQPPGSPGFFAGNSKFLTRKLWGIANQHSFGHHGLYTTMREAVLAHHGEGLGLQCGISRSSQVRSGFNHRISKVAPDLASRGEVVLCKPGREGHRVPSGSPTVR
jgi:hypothetical protein